MLILAPMGLWGSVEAHEFLCDAVILSDDAGQFNIAGMRWVKPTRRGWCINWIRSPTSIAPHDVRGFAA